MIYDTVKSVFIYVILIQFVPVISHLYAYNKIKAKTRNFLYVLGSLLLLIFFIVMLTKAHVYIKLGVLVFLASFNIFMLLKLLITTKLKMQHRFPFVYSLLVYIAVISLFFYDIERATSLLDFAYDSIIPLIMISRIVYVSLGFLMIYELAVSYYTFVNDAKHEFLEEKLRMKYISVALLIGLFVALFTLAEVNLSEIDFTSIVDLDARSNAVSQYSIVFERSLNLFQFLGSAIVIPTLLKLYDKKEK